MEFVKKATVRALDIFTAKADVAEVLAFVKAQRVPGELVISLPGNGGVSGITFREKEQVHDAETPNGVV